MLNLVFPDGMKVAIIAEKIHYTGKQNCYLYLAQDFDACVCIDML